MFRSQPVIGHAEIAGGEHLFAVLVVLKRTRFPDETFNDMSVIDQALLTPDQTRHALHFLVRIANDDFIHVNQAVHLTSNQTTMHGVRILLHSNHTAAADSNSLTERSVVNLLKRQLMQVFLLLKEPVPPGKIPMIHDLLQKLPISRVGWKVAAAAKQQCLLDGRFEMSVRRLNITILMSLTNIDSMSHKSIVIEEFLIPTSQFISCRQVIHGCAQAVGAMPIRHTTHFPERSLQTVAQRFK